MKKILVAHDGSRHSQKALKKAIEIGEKFKSTLIILSIIPELHLTELAPLDEARLREAMEKETEKYLKKASAALKAKKIPVKTVIAQGNAAEVIMEVARKQRVGMIVIGSHGRQGVERFLLGSVSSNVVEHADRPVLVVK